MDKFNLLDVITRIDKLTTREKLHILNILKQYDSEFSKNSNGYFFNLSDVPEEVIDKICTCLTLMETNRDILHKMDIRRNELLVYYKNLIEDKLSMTINEKRASYLERIVLKPIPTNIYKKVTRILKIKLHQKHSKDVDPDDLIKEAYSIKNNYGKDSVFFRIHTRLKAIKSKRKVQHSKDEDSEVKGKNIGDDANEDADDMGDMGDMGDDYLEDVDNYDNDEVDIDEVDGVEGSEEIFDTEKEHSDNESDANDADANEDDMNDTRKTDAAIDSEMIFYKRLLNDKGFTFDENKHCILTYQPYVH